jgi:hypothetical protein
MMRVLAPKVRKNKVKPRDLIKRWKILTGDKVQFNSIQIKSTKQPTNQPNKQTKLNTIKPTIM